MSQSSLSEDATWSAVVAEAATWIALLHGPDRTEAAERGLKSWLAEDPLHARAFELATETWNETRAFVKRGAKVKLILPGEKGVPIHRRWRPAMAAALVALLVGSGIAVSFYLQKSAVATGIGERRILALEDGTQVYLNTATQVVVDYSKNTRRIRLKSGEALFDVAKRSGWPFIVTVGNRDITALGTSFLVRADDERIAVTLVEGKVTVSPDPASTNHITLVPGQRLVLAEHKAPVVDLPELEKLTAWQNGKVNIDNLSLADAVVEMNRYSVVQLEVAGSAAATLRLSGIFRIGDSRNFANAVARTHGLAFKDEGHRIVLSGTPHSTDVRR